MGMSMHIVGFKPADEEWEKMKKVWIACEEAGIEIPDAVIDYFNGEDPDDKPGMEVKLGEAYKKIENEYHEGYEIDISKVPKGVKFIRVYNSW